MRYRTGVVSLSLGPWAALAGAVLGAASVLLRRLYDDAAMFPAAEALTPVTEPDPP